MVEATEGRGIEKGLLTLWIIWAAIFTSLFIYVFIAHQFGEGMRRTANPDFPTGLFKNILYVVVAVTLFLTYFLRKLTLAGRFIGSKDKLFKPTSVSDQPPLIHRYTTAVIVSLALSESIGIYGFILFFFGDNFLTLYTFIGISALELTK